MFIIYGVIFALLHLQTGSPHLEFAQIQFCVRETIRDIRICQAYFHPLSDHEGQRGNNIMRANISLHTVLIYCPSSCSLVHHAINRLFDFFFTMVDHNQPFLYCKDMQKICQLLGAAKSFLFCF